MSSTHPLACCEFSGQWPALQTASVQLCNNPRVTSKCTCEKGWRSYSTWPNLICSFHWQVVSLCLDIQKMIKSAPQMWSRCFDPVFIRPKLLSCEWWWFGEINQANCSPVYVVTFCTMSAIRTELAINHFCLLTCDSDILLTAGWTWVQLHGNNLYMMGHKDWGHRDRTKWWVNMRFKWQLPH